MGNLRKNTFVVACLCAAALATGWNLGAQDVFQVAPNNARLLLENERVRVFEFSAKPGFKEPQHSHPAHVVYVVKGGKVRFTAPDGSSQEVELQAGQAVWGDPTTHTVEFLGPAMRRWSSWN
jgi:quercetin dioxygenase-like cupin family protein